MTIMDLSTYLPATLEQWLLVLYFILALSFFLMAAELSRRIFHLPNEITRKFIHIIVGLCVVFFSFQIDHPQPIIFLCLLFIIANLLIFRYNLIPAISNDRKSYGIIFYPISMLFSIIILWDDYKFIYYNVILILSLADAAAAIAGQRFKNPHYYKIWHDTKTFQGSIAMFLSSFFIINLSYYFIPHKGYINLSYPIFLVSIGPSLIITISEAISCKGSDNISIALTAAFILYVVFYSEEVVQFQFILSLLFVVIFSFLSYKFKLLTIDGTIAAAFLAFIIFGIGGWTWTIPILVFFIFSSILSKLKNNLNLQLRSKFEKASKRDAMQVFANGAVSLFFVILYVFYSKDVVYFLYLSALAAAAADTWATELGVLSTSYPRKISNFKHVEIGTSGAISLQGTFAALSGSCSIALTGYFFNMHMTVAELIAIICTGFLASIIDSFLGATVQAQYISSKNHITEKDYSPAGDKNRLISGYPSINNDAVNLLAILTTPVFYCIFILIYK